MRDSFILYTQYKRQVDMLTNEQAGALFKAVMCYESGEALPDMDPMTEMLFSIFQGRLDADAERYDQVCKTRAEAGKKGGRPKANGSDEKAKKANGFLALSEKAKESKSKQKNPDIDFDSDIDIDSEKHLKTTECARGEDRRFDIFWEAYPKKVGKLDARRAWKKANVTIPLFAKIMESLKAAAASDQWTREGGRFVPNPSTWLKQGRWDDDIGTYPGKVIQGTRFSNFDERRDDIDDVALTSMRRLMG